MNPQKRDLTTWDCVVAKKTAASCTAKKIMPVRINGELIILKTVATRQLYKRSKDVYFILKDETFLPTLKYFDDKHLILGLSDVGDAVTIYKYKHPRQYNKLLEKFNNELKNIINKLFDKYG